MQRLLNLGLKILYPFMYFGKKKGSSYLYCFKDKKFLVRTGTSDKLVIWEIFKKNEYTDDTFFTLQKEDVVFDIGANIGAFTVFSSSKVKKVYSFEPFKENFESLKKNCELNKCKNVSLYNIAISDKNGSIPFHCSTENFGGSSAYKKTYTKNSILVKCITLEDALKKTKVKRINFLKLDVEGSEYNILLSTKNSTLQNIDKISMEYHDNVNHGHTYRDIIKKLQQAGFKVKNDTNFFSKHFFKVGRLKAINKRLL